MDQAINGYYAFLSYSHKDENIVKRFHKRLERRKLPRFGNGSNNLFPIFRDEDELPMSSNLSKLIKTALSQSKYLIVFLSANSIKSNWVKKEIHIFLENNSVDKLIVIILNPTEIPLEHPLYSIIDKVTTYNLLHDGERRTILKVCSTISGVNEVSIWLKGYIRLVGITISVITGAIFLVGMMIVLGSVITGYTMYQVERFGPRPDLSTTDRLFDRLYDPVSQFGMVIDQLEKTIESEPKAVIDYIFVYDMMLSDIESGEEELTSEQQVELKFYKEKYEKIKKRLLKLQ